VEAREREQPGVPNTSRRELLSAKLSPGATAWAAVDLQTPRLGSRYSLIICPAPVATGSWPHQLPVAFAGKEELRGAYRLDTIGR
jgi:hypothetical protein